MDTISLGCEINKILNERHIKLHQDLTIFNSYKKIFKQPNNPEQHGNGEKPSWNPNEAYMLSLEWLWEPIDAFLLHGNLAINAKLRVLFKDSIEFLDFTDEHRRLFYGQIINIKNSKAITGFTLNVPHSHATFLYPKPVTIQITPTLEEL